MKLKISGLPNAALGYLIVPIFVLIAVVLFPMLNHFQQTDANSVEMSSASQNQDTAVDVNSLPSSQSNTEGSNQ